MELNERELSIAELEASHTFKEQPILNTSRSGRLCGNQPLTNSPKRALNADPENHKVAFSKQLNGLLKEARQLATSSDAEVAVIVFSTTGKLGEFASSSMEKIVNRYHRYEGRPQFTYSQSRAPQNVHWIKQAIDIKSPTEVLDGIQSDLAADKVPGVSVRELQNAELRLETLRTEIRKRKGRLLASQMQHILNQTEEVLQSNKCKKNRTSVETECSSET